MFSEAAGEIGEQTFPCSTHGVPDSRGPGDGALPRVLDLFWLSIPSHGAVAL